MAPILAAVSGAPPPHSVVTGLASWYMRSGFLFGGGESVDKSHAILVLPYIVVPTKVHLS